MIALPTIAGRYECLERLGGNMAAVYRARDTRTGQIVVVKLPVSDDDRVLARFRKEANILCRVRHPGIVGGIDAGEWSGKPFVVMDYLEGATLKQLLEQRAFGPDEAGLACWIALQIARGLRHLHAAGIVHRDVKPDNIRVNADWHAQLIDLGIARTQDSSLTRAKEVIGTPKYMAPEQVLGHAVDQQTDIYSFGVVFFEMLTGQVPYRSQQAVELRFYLTIINSPPRLEALDEIGAQPELRDLLRLCLEKDKEKRAKSFDDVIASLQPLVPADLLRPEAIPVRDEAPVVAVVSRRRFTWYAVGAFAAGAGATTAYLHLRDRSAPDTEMVRIAAGSALIGAGNKPLTIPAFQIDKTEVTNRQFLEFCDNTTHAAPPGIATRPPEHPVVNVTIQDARAYARWAGKRLPRPAEWERAVRGSAGRIFPWGPAFQPGRANLQTTAELARKATLMDADSLPAGATPEGVLHLIGNVWEWIDEFAQPDDREFAYLRDVLLPKISPPLTRTEAYYQVRGGGAGELFELPDVDRLAFQASAMPARARLGNVGFRCVKDV